MKRRIPGPAGQSSHQDDAPSSLSNQQSPNPHVFSFQSLDSWKSMMTSLGLINGSDSNRTTITPIIDIHQGLCDAKLRVPLMIAVIEQVQLSEGTWIINMKDESGTITGFLPLDAAKINPNILSKYSSVLLQKVALFVSKEIDFSSVEAATEHGQGKSRFKRYLNLHKNCISAVFTAAMLRDRDGEDVTNASCSNGNAQDAVGMDKPAEYSNLPAHSLTRSSSSSSSASAAAASMSAVSEDYSACHFPATTSAATSIWDFGEGSGLGGELPAHPVTIDMGAPKRKRAVD